MKTKGFTYILYVIAVFAASLLWACEDDFKYNPGAGVDGRMTEVPVTVGFDRESEVDITSRALGEHDGDAIQDIESFWMLIYNPDGTLYQKFKIMENGKALPSDNVKNIDYERYDNRLPEEKADYDDNSGGRLKFDLNIISARYFIYGVANVADFDSKDVSTRDKLKSIECVWDSTALAKNSEMYGVFSIGQNRDATDVQTVPVRSDGAQLHCWLRRLASKVTVAFDGSELYNDVEIYIDTIMVCDVAKKCVLGMPNYPGRDRTDLETYYDSKLRYVHENGVIALGGMQKIQELSSSDIKDIVPQSYYHVCNGSHIYGGISSDATDPAINKEKHSFKAKSLYFYENLQGDGKDKRQSLDGVTIWKPNPIPNDLESGWKDGKAYGTYVEVRGYYRYTTPVGEVNAGWIKYRFMLGQDAEKNYDVFRNTHYQLTLKLRGYGNDYDWHIDYKENTGIYSVSPQFISYLYNKSMYATVKIVGKIKEGTKVHAEIISDIKANNLDYTYWRQWGNGKANAEGEVEFPDPTKKTLTGPNGETLPLSIPSVSADADGPWTSFLTLRKNNILRIVPPGLEGAPSITVTTSEALKVLKNFYIDRTEGFRDFAITEAEVEQQNKNEADIGTYSMQITRYKNDEAVERLYRIPLFTRAKELVTRTGFTGNNPFTAYPRKQTVRFSAEILNETTGQYENRTFDIDVIQVRRVVNPKGVWRSAEGNKDPFHITLMRLPEDNAPNFVPFKSVGKWSAEVVAQSDPIISLSSTVTGSGNDLQTGSRRIDGEDEHYIDFNINFNGAKGFAIVRVRYHNYTCEHDVFCQVGLDPVEIVAGKAKWHPTNVHRFEADGTAVYATSPLQEGSLFRRGSLTAILPDNSPVNDVQVTPNGNNTMLKVLKPGSSVVETIKWSECNPTAAEKAAYFNTWNIKNPGQHIADCMTDYYTLTSLVDNDPNFYIKKAYGVLYGDGADVTATNVDEAYGYSSMTGEPSTKGMRGVFVYNQNTAKFIFLPIGKSGHGRRKGTAPTWVTPKDYPATMRYAARTAPNTAMKDQPLFYDLYRRPGAVYWCMKYGTMPKVSYEYKNTDGTITRGSYEDVRYSSSFDINFFTMGFEGYSNGSIENGVSDALFIRTVHGDAPAR